jgi:hypothetical protein
MSQQKSLLSLSDAERQLAKLKVEYSEVSSRISALSAGRGIGQEERNRSKVMKALFTRKASLRKDLLAIEVRISEFPASARTVRRLQPVLNLQEAERQLAELNAEHSEVSELIRSHDVGEDGDGAEVRQALFMCQMAIRNSIAAIHRRINELEDPG